MGVRFRPAEKEEKRMGGHTCRMLVAGEAPDQELAKGGAPVPATKGRPRQREGGRRGGLEKESRKVNGLGHNSDLCPVAKCEMFFLHRKKNDLTIRFLVPRIDAP